MHSLANSVNDARSKYDCILSSSHDHQLNDPSATTPHAAINASLVDGLAVGRVLICVAERRGGGLCHLTSHLTSLLRDGGEGSSRSEYDRYVVVLTVYIQAAG
jgi:hypothetical protein